MSERWRLRPSGDTTVEIPESFALVAGNVVRVPPAVISVVPSWRPQAIVDGSGRPVGVVRFAKWAVIKHRAWRLWRRLTS